MDKYHLEMESCGKHWNRVRKAICSGYFVNAAKKDPQEGYKTLVEQQPVYVHPSSALFNRQVQTFSSTIVSTNTTDLPC